MGFAKGLDNARIKIMHMNLVSTQYPPIYVSEASTDYHFLSEKKVHTHNNRLDMLLSWKYTIMVVVSFFLGGGAGV